MGSERLTKGVYTHHTEGSWEEIKENGGLVGRRARATLSRFSHHGLGGPVIITVWQAQPGEIHPSTEYLPEGENAVSYPTNINLYEIAVSSHENIEIPERFLRCQRRRMAEEDLRFLPIERCIAIIPGSKKLLQAVIKISLFKQITEDKTTSILLRALKKQKNVQLLAPGLSREILAKTLAQLWVENQIGLAINKIRKICERTTGEGLKASSPVPLYFEKLFGLETEQAIGDLILSLRKTLASAKLSSPYLQRYRRMLITEVDQRLEKIG